MPPAPLAGPPPSGRGRNLLAATLRTRGRVAALPPAKAGHANEPSDA